MEAQMKLYAVMRGGTIVNNWKTKSKAIYNVAEQATAYAEEMNQISDGYYVADYIPKKQREIKEKK